MDPNTAAPTDKLLADAVKQLSSLGSTVTTVSQVLETRDSVVYAAIQAAIDKANESAVSNAQKVMERGRERYRRKNREKREGGRDG